MAIYDYKKKKLKILLCGNHEPKFNVLEKAYKAGTMLHYDKKFRKNEKFTSSERLKFSKSKLEKDGHVVKLGAENYTGIRSTLDRVLELMTWADLIIIFLENKGGSLMEHTITHCYVDFLPKTVNLIEKDAILSGMLRKGTFLRKDNRVHEYKDTKDMYDYVNRIVDEHQKSQRFKPPISVLRKQKA